MENQDLDTIFSEINNLQLSYDDLVGVFLEYLYCIDDDQLSQTKDENAAITSAVVQKPIQVNYSLQLRHHVLRDFKFLTPHTLEALLEIPDFLQAAVLCARQSMILSVLSLSLSKGFTAEQFEQMCQNCNAQGSKQYYLQKTIDAINKALVNNSAPAMSEQYIKNLLQDCNQMLTSFEKEVYTKTLWSNKDSYKHTELNKAIVESRKDIFFNLFA